MKFNSTDEAARTIRKYKSEFLSVRTNGKIRAERVQYSIELKRATIEYFLASGDTVRTFCNCCDISQTLLYKWKQDYLDGLYDNSDAAIAVSRPAKKVMSALDEIKQERDNLQREIEELNQSIELIHKLESQGFSVLKKVA